MLPVAVCVPRGPGELGVISLNLANIFEAASSRLPADVGVNLFAAVAGVVQ